MKHEAVYTGLDSSREHPSEYQDLVNPDALKTVDDYLTLDVTSRQVEQEYQDLDHTSSTSGDNRDPGKKRPLQVPVPPTVEAVESSTALDGPYVNVKEKTKDRSGTHANKSPTFDNPERESVASYEDVKPEAVYTGLDSSQQEHIEYQDLVNPDLLKTADNYLNLDATSRQVEQEYQHLNT